MVLSLPMNADISEQNQGIVVSMLQRAVIDTVKD